MKGLQYLFNLNSGYNYSESQYIQSGIRAFLDIQFFDLFHKPWGVDLDALIFDSVDAVFLDFLEEKIASALKQYEPINLNYMQFDEEPNQPNSLIVNLFYTINSTGQQDYYSYILDRN